MATVCEPRKKSNARRAKSRARRCPGGLWIHGPSPQTQERQKDPRDAVIERAVARALAEQARREALATEAALRQEEADRSRAEGSSAAREAAAHVAAVQRHRRDAQSPREEKAAQQDTLSLFEEVKQVISSQLTTDNVAVLASISNTANGDGTYNLSAIEDALDAIRVYFDGHNSTEDRHTLYNIYVARMLIENAPQLVEKYNRIVKNVRKFFPGFNLVREEHNHIFGRLASLSCIVRRCSEQEIEAEQYGRELNPADLQDSDVGYVLEHFDEYYGKQYADDINGKARSLANRHGSVYTHKVFSANLAKMLDYTSYTGSGFSVINDLLRGNRPEDAADLGFMVDRFAAFAHHLALPMYTNDDLVLYRGDGFRTSPPTLTAMGFYSGALSPTDMEYFVRDGGRVISIHVPSGTPILPAILADPYEGEIILLPGTILEKQSRMPLDRGHFAEYRVVYAPPRLSELEEATILMNSIHRSWTRLQRAYLRSVPGEGREFVESLPDSTAPGLDETKEFVLGFLNSKYR